MRKFIRIVCAIVIAVAGAICAYLIAGEAIDGVHNSVVVLFLAIIAAVVFLGGVSIACLIAQSGYENDPDVEQDEKTWLTDDEPKEQCSCKYNGNKCDC